VRWRLWLTLAAIPVAAGLVAWLLGGNAAWKISGIIAGVVLGLAAFPVFKEAIGALRRDPASAGWMVLLYGYCAAVLGVWFGVGYAFQTATVHVENYSPRELRVELDGQGWLGGKKRLTCPPASSTPLTLRNGDYRVTVRSADGRELEKHEVTAEGGSVYVLNLLRAQKYYRGTVRYGGLSIFGGGGKPEEVTDGWFKADVDYLFENPPGTIQVRVSRGMQGLTSESRTYLTRGQPPPKPR
jgi:hypothetical protein